MTQTKNKNIAIFINGVDSVFAIDSLRGQDFEDWQCFLVNCSIEKIKDYVNQDPRFHIINESKNIIDIIQNIPCEYVFMINSNDVFAPNALTGLARIIDLGNTDIIKCPSIKFSKYNEFENLSGGFDYIFQNKEILKYFFELPLYLCINKKLFEKTDFNTVPDLWMLTMLNVAQNMALAHGTYILHQMNTDIFSNRKNYRDVIDYYCKNKQMFSIDFWKKFFKCFIPKFVKNTIKDNDKLTFTYCAKKIPLHFIPLKYKFIFFIMKAFN